MPIAAQAAWAKTQALLRVTQPCLILATLGRSTLARERQTDPTLVLHEAQTGLQDEPGIGGSERLPPGIISGQYIVQQFLFFVGVGLLVGCSRACSGPLRLFLGLPEASRGPPDRRLQPPCAVTFCGGGSLGFCLAPLGLLGHASGHPHGVPFVLGAWGASTCCVSVSMWFLLVSGGGSLVLSGAPRRAWGGLGLSPRHHDHCSHDRAAVAALVVLRTVWCLGVFSAVAGLRILYQHTPSNCVQLRFPRPELDLQAWDLSWEPGG